MPLNKLLKTARNILIVVFFVIMPIALWLFSAPFSSRFGNLEQNLTSLGRVLGLVGMSLFSLNFILSARSRFLDNIFFGLNEAYKAHHIIGAIAFILVMFHPLALAGSYAVVSLQAALYFFWPFDKGPEIIFGSVALVLMTILLVMTFYLRPRYDIWKITHKFLSLAFVFAFLHLIYIKSDVYYNPFLRAYMILISFLGMAAIIYQQFLRKIFVKSFQYRVVLAKPVNPVVTELVLSPIKEKITHIAGQFIYLKFDNPKIGKEQHPFTIASSPNEKNLKIAVKKLGDYTEKLPLLKNQDAVFIEGPYGRFSYLLYPEKNQVWIAGGIGITPFLSMARDLNVKNLDYSIDLFYSVKDEKEAVFIDELYDISLKNPRFKARQFISQTQGLLTAESVQKISGQVSGKEIFICGPASMMESLRRQFLAMGVKNNKIHTEEFAL
ncbi:MAG: ferric reductase-like transmembrane domain-containing protein [Candidatus Staskawiczbacteria bacterium]|nr:ferric reductase-like transmembrane domain-containing protein [Candidatus Staskawiczbacteria bacterium]